MLKVSFVPGPTKLNGVIALPVFEGPKLGAQGTKLDAKLGGAIKRALKAAPSFKGEKGQSLVHLAPGKNQINRLVLIGAGAPGKADALAFEHIGGALAAALKPVSEAVFFLDEIKGLATSAAEAAAHLALGARLRAYRFEKYQTKKAAEKKEGLKTLSIALATPAAAKKAFAPLDPLSQSVVWARDLISEPPNMLDPEAMMKEARKLEALGVKVDVLDRKQMEKLGMGSLLAVARGSVKPPYLVAMSWPGDPHAKDQRPFAFVGKGVTFDAGGLCLKTRQGMEEMKVDMAGAATVIGAIRAAALRKAKANLVGVIGLVENMPSGDALRPGDIVTSASGQTIEVLNTDAEGRLLLADAMWYAQEKFNPRGLIDLATLTYVMIAVIGRNMAGLFPTDDALADALIQAGLAVDEPVWRFPMGAEFAKLVHSEIADLKNISGGPDAQSVVAAEFLHKFVNPGVPWAHIDLGVSAMILKDRPTCPKGATAFGVRLLDRFISDFCEK